jgi:hypothetical protein
MKNISTIILVAAFAAACFASTDHSQLKSPAVTQSQSSQPIFKSSLVRNLPTLGRDALLVESENFRNLSFKVIGETSEDASKAQNTRFVRGLVSLCDANKPNSTCYSQAFVTFRRPLESNIVFVIQTPNDHGDMIDTGSLYAAPFEHKKTAGTFLINVDGYTLQLNYDLVDYYGQSETYIKDENSFLGHSVRSY